MKPKYNSIKGRKLQTYLRNKLLKVFPHLKENDIDVAKTGENGPDIKLSRIAKRLIPYQFETKSQQRMKTIYQWHRQASKKTNLDGVVLMKSNGQDPLVVISLDLFLDLIK
jgi:hypothetical protein|tara:strand:- start:13 stop:345 length:333 start_codon:yes stop_codon:yes gene_type:complete